jgi:hypothetical protein
MGHESLQRIHYSYVLSQIMYFRKWVSTDTFHTLILDTEYAAICSEFALFKDPNEVWDFIFVASLEYDLRPIVFLWRIGHILIHDDFLDEENDFFDKILELLVLFAQFGRCGFNATDQVVYVKNYRLLSNSAYLILISIVVDLDIIRYGLQFL